MNEKQSLAYSVERKLFEDWYAADALPSEANWFKRDKDEPDEYDWITTHEAWKAWKARGVLPMQQASIAVANDGTPAGRFHRLMGELQKRFPDPDPVAGAPYESRLLAMLDTVLAAKIPNNKL
jgi:hypothetical protein